MLCLCAGFLMSVFHAWCSELHLAYMLSNMSWSERQAGPVEIAVHLLQLADFPSLMFWLGGVYVGNYYAGLIGFLMGCVTADSIGRTGIPSTLWKIIRWFAVLLFVCDVIAVCLMFLTDDFQRQTAFLDSLSRLIPASLWTLIALSMMWVRMRDPRQNRNPAFCHVVAYFVCLLNFGCFLLIVANIDNIRGHSPDVTRFLHLLESTAFVIYLPASTFGSILVMWVYVPIFGYILGYILARFANNDVFRVARWSLAWWFAVTVVVWNCISAAWMIHEFGPRIDVPGWKGLFFLVPLPLTWLCFAYMFLWKRIHRSVMTPD